MLGKGTNQMKITEAELLKFLQNNNIALGDVIDAVIAENHIIGVGVITLAEQLSGIVMSHLDVN